MADNDLIPPPIANGGTGSISAGRVNAPDYRQLEQPAQGLEPWRLQNDGAAERAEALSSAFKQAGSDISSVSQDVLGKIRTDQGKVAGAAAGMDPNFKPLTGLKAVTNYGQAYDAAAHVSYITQSQLSLEQSLTGIEADTQGDPNAFAARAGAQIQKQLKNIDPLYQPELSNWATARIQAGVNRQTQQAQLDVKNQALADYQSSTPDLIAAAIHTSIALPKAQGDQVIATLVENDKDRLNALAASRTIKPEDVNELHQEFIKNTDKQMTGARVNLSLQPILDSMKTNVEAADKLVVQDDPNLTVHENAARLAEFEKERAAYVESQARAHVDDLAAVHQNLAAGKYGADVEPALHSLYKAGALNEEGLFSGLAESLRNQQDDIKDGADMKLVEDTVRGDRPGPLDPKDKHQASAVDKYFQNRIGSLSASDPQYAMGAAEIFRQTGILPASVQSQIRVGLMSGDPNRAASAAALAAKVQGVNPEADAFVSNPKLTALSSLINTNLKAGLSPQQAYTMAVNATDIPEGQRKIRDAGYATALKAQGTNQAALQSALNAATPGIFSKSPPPPVAMQADFESLTRQYYDQTGNLPQARQIAAQQLHQTWGVSTVNGTPELVKHPIPDALVPTVRADIASSAKDAGYTGDPSAIRLTPNANTDSSGGKIWSLTHVDPSGATDVLLDHNNRPLQYSVPAGPDFAKQRQAIIDQHLAEARKQRDFERSVTSDKIPHEQELSKFYLSSETQRLVQQSAGAK